MRTSWEPDTSALNVSSLASSHIASPARADPDVPPPETADTDDLWAALPGRSRLRRIRPPASTPTPGAGAGVAASTPTPGTVENRTAAHEALRPAYPTRPRSPSRTHLPSSRPGRPGGYGATLPGRAAVPLTAVSFDGLHPALADSHYLHTVAQVDLLNDEVLRTALAEDTAKAKASMRRDTEWAVRHNILPRTVLTGGRTGVGSKSGSPAKMKPSHAAASTRPSSARAARNRASERRVQAELHQRADAAIERSQATTALAARAGIIAPRGGDQDNSSDDNGDDDNPRSGSRASGIPGRVAPVRRTASGGSGAVATTQTDVAAMRRQIAEAQVRLRAREDADGTTERLAAKAARRAAKAQAKASEVNPVVANMDAVASRIEASLRQEEERVAKQGGEFAPSDVDAATGKLDQERREARFAQLRKDMDRRAAEQDYDSDIEREMGAEAYAKMKEEEELERLRKEEEARMRELEGAWAEQDAWMERYRIAIGHLPPREERDQVHEEHARAQAMLEALLPESDEVTYDVPGTYPRTGNTGGAGTTGDNGAGAGTTRSGGGGDKEHLDVDLDDLPDENQPPARHSLGSSQQPPPQQHPTPSSASQPDTFDQVLAKLTPTERAAIADGSGFFPKYSKHVPKVLGPDNVAQATYPDGGAGKPPKKKPPTVPQPFAFAERDEQGRSRPTIAQAKLEADLEMRRQEEELAMSMRGKFVANPLPQSTLEPRYEQMLEEQEMRRSISAAMNREWLQAMQKPFSFAERDAQRQAEKAARQHATAQARANRFQKPFKATPVPTFVVEDRFSSLMNDMELKKAELRLRARKLLEESSMPKRMEEAMRRETERMGGESSSSAAWDQPRNTGSRPKKVIKNFKAKAVPNFRELHAKFNEQKEKAKRDMPRTVPDVFHLADCGCPRCEAKRAATGGGKNHIRSLRHAVYASTQYTPQDLRWPHQRLNSAHDLIHLFRAAPEEFHQVGIRSRQCVHGNIVN